MNMNGKNRELTANEQPRALTLDELSVVSGGTFNEAQTLSSSVLKKKDDTANAVIQKI
jgi:hypothetical protein